MTYTVHFQNGSALVVHAPSVAEAKAHGEAVVKRAELMLKIGRAPAPTEAKYANAGKVLKVTYDAVRVESCEETYD